MLPDIPPFRPLDRLDPRAAAMRVDATRQVRPDSAARNTRFASDAVIEEIRIDTRPREERGIAHQSVRPSSMLHESAGFAAQRYAQEDSRDGLHLEDWRGLNTAYNRALTLNDSTPRRVSLLV
jgi:hypothetical protein